MPFVGKAGPGFKMVAGLPDWPISFHILATLCRPWLYENGLELRVLERGAAKGQQRKPSKEPRMRQMMRQDFDMSCAVQPR